MNTKTCTCCKQDKSLDKFYKANNSKDGCSWYCKQCIRKQQSEFRIKNPNYNKEHCKDYYNNHIDYRKQYKIDNKDRDNQRRREDYKNDFSKYKEQHLKSAYGISLDDYLKMLESQNNTCAICSKKETRINPKTKRIHLLSVDHNHKTGKVRGLLCMKCNPGIGNFQEDVDLLQSAIKYIQKYK